MPPRLEQDTRTFFCQPSLPCRQVFCFFFFSVALGTRLPAQCRWACRLGFGVGGKGGLSVPFCLCPFCRCAQAALHVPDPSRYGPLGTQTILGKLCAYAFLLSTVTMMMLARPQALPLPHPPSSQKRETLSVFFSDKFPCDLRS